MRKEFSMHLLDFTKGRAAIAFRGETPWHGYGSIINPDDDLDTIITKAGADYDVIERPVFYGVQGNEGKRRAVTIPGKKALLRDDTQDFLSIVGSDYHTVQPRKVFEFFRELLKKQGLSIETGGVLKDGNIVWALAKVDDDFTVYGQDRIDPYVLVATSYDLSLSTTAMFTGIRVVCFNTLNFSGAFTASDEQQGVFKVRHDREFSITEAHGKLGLNEAAWMEHKRQIQRLASLTVTPDEVLEYFYTVAGQDDKIVRNEDNGNIITFPEPGRVVKQFINAYHNGPGANLRSAKGTMWGAVNAVTFYQDHLAPAGNRGKRFTSATFGGGNVRKQHAYDLALAKFEEAAVA